MKLLVSDYDLTFNVLDYCVRVNINAVNKFMKNGNKFFLNTGRCFESIKEEIDKYHINYDYLGCNDGNLVLNRNNDILFCSNLSINILNELETLKKDYHFDINLFKYQDNILEYEIKTMPNLKFDLILNTFALNNGLCIKKFEIPRIVNGKLMKMWVYYLYDKKVNKASATDLVGKLENIEKYDIFTIGDNLNDYEMIRDYNGYTFPWGRKEVKEVSDGQVLSVKGLVKKISR